MAVFYSFHYKKDCWRVQELRNMGAIDGSNSVAAQEWESVRYKTESSIRNWIDTQMNYKRAVVVLIGEETADRDWVKYEIERAWSLRKPLLGIEIHGLKDQHGHESKKGANPFEILGSGYSNIPIFTPYGIDSKERFNWIKENLSDLIVKGYKRP